MSFFHCPRDHQDLYALPHPLLSTKSFNWSSSSLSEILVVWLMVSGSSPCYPISMLPEHLHSTFPSHAKLPENTLTEKKNIPFPSLTLITCLTGPPVTPPPFTGRPSHTLSYTTILFLALKVNGRFLESLPVVTFASLELKLPVFLFINFY